MIAPMLAAPMSKADIRDWNDWVMEEKFDGWRLVVTIPSKGGDITAHTRERKHAGGGPKDQNNVTDMLPADMMQGLEALRPRSGCVVLDGELLAIHKDGRVGTSTDVPRKELAKRYVVFDVLTVREGSVMMQSYAQRRNILETLVHGVTSPGVMLSDARPCIDSDAVAVFCHEVWDRGGEGLILKNRDARYEPGKRRVAFVKIKKLLTAVGVVTGWEATRGKVMNRGEFATVVLKLSDGRVTSVKTKNDYELEQFRLAAGNTLNPILAHPALGRKLRIEYQDDAADGGVRHPRWDRWEDE